MNRYLPIFIFQRAERRGCLLNGQLPSAIEQPTFPLMTAVPDDGGGERIRTDDPLRAKQVLSQLSYTPASYTHDRPEGGGPNWT